MDRQKPQNIINLVRYDIGEKQAKVDIFDNLSKLDDLIRHVTSTLETRLTANHNKLQDVHRRVISANTKIDALKNSQKAITIVSPAKFPKHYDFDHKKCFESVIRETEINSHNVTINYDRPTVYYNPSWKDEMQKPLIAPIKIDELNSVIKVINSMTPARDLFDSRHGIQHKKLEGLGSLPHNLTYLDSLLVFNSSTNPYQSYTSFDNLMNNPFMSSVVKRKVQDDKDRIQLVEAPRTLVEGEALPHYDRKDYKYKPQARALPEIKAPMQLLLKGIVDADLDKFDAVDIFAPSQGGTKSKNVAPEPNMTRSNAQAGNNQTGDTSSGLNSISMVQSVTISQPTNKSSNQGGMLSIPTNNTTTTLSPPLLLNTTTNNPSSSSQPSGGTGNSLLPPPTGLLPPPNLLLNLGGPSASNNSGNSSSGGGTLPPPNLNLLAGANNNQQSGSGGGLSLPPPNLTLNLNPSPNSGPPTKDLQNLPPPQPNRNALLEQIRDPNNFKRLKKVAPPVEKKIGVGRVRGAKDDDPPAKDDQPQQPSKADAGKTLSHLELLKNQISLRYQALNKGSKGPANKVSKKRDSSESASNSD